MSTHTATLLERRVYRASGRLRLLSEHGSDLAVQLERAADLPLREYLRSLVPGPEAWPNVHRMRLVRAVEGYLVRHGDHDVDAVCDHLLHTPVIQQADHSNLLLDHETFLNNYLFHLASREAGVRVAVTNQCSTVSCLARRTPVLGPTFLRSRASLYSVLPMSKTALKNSSFCGIPGPVTMTFDFMEGNHPDVATDPVFARLAGHTAPDGPTAYRQANDMIWRDLAVDHGVRRVSIDESVVSECVALHLADPDGPVYRLLFDPQVRDAFLRAKRRLVADPSNLTVNRAAPDFVWLRKGPRLHQVELVGTGPDAQWIVETNGAPLPVPFEPAAVIEALRTGVLYADRVLAYLVRCLLPGWSPWAGPASRTTSGCTGACWSRPTRRCRSSARRTSTGYAVPT
ncbi:hypothetical protein [Phytohabitans rumicis]|uniref:Uncharacterized protein n=1 Tax=Phytohabitans rumicis TaxID=1076125 RepID=A0A6V8L354_9ACTN|nr:hypothetical protein [Phytohabitans rumicis]GFJ89079.1 hypothetical protein Prum_027210 [Phytohabitans rumicis]